MPFDWSRRRYLAGLGAAAVGVSGPFAGPARAQCEPADDLRDELESKRETLDALRAEQSTLEERIDDLEAALPDARAAWIESKHEFPADQRETARAVGTVARESVVVIELDFGASSSGGTGWFYGDGLVVTNSHVVDGFPGADDTRGWTLAGEEIALEFVDRVETLAPDVGLLRTDHDAPALPLGDSSTLSAGDPLVAVGHPGSYGNWVISLGAYDRRNQHDSEEIVTDVPSLQGNSGSPTLNFDGEVVAMLKGAGGIPATDAAPEPATPDVQTEPIAPEEDVLHDSIETIVDTVEGWT